MDVYDFGIRLRTLREQKGYTQAELASKVHVTAQSISGYENNIQSPPLDTATRICTILNTSLDSLVNLDTRFLLNISNFSPTKRELIARFIRLIEETEETEEKK